MTALVIGGTGTVGSEAVRELVKRGSQVRVMTRSPQKLAGLPQGATAVAGDLQRPDTLAAALAGVDAVFLATAVAPDEMNQGLAAVEAAKAAGVRRFVFMSVQDVEQGMHIPHFASKIPIEHAVKVSGIPWTILRPNNFFQNDLGFRDAMIHGGVYPQPMSVKGISRVDVRDIAEAAAICLTSEGPSGRTFVIAGPDALTGEDTASIYTRALGRQVQYTGGDVATWAAMAKSIMPAWLALDLQIMFSHFAERGLVAAPADLATLTTLLGHPPRSFESFVKEHFAAN